MKHIISHNVTKIHKHLHINEISHKIMMINMSLDNTFDYSHLFGKILNLSYMIDKHN